MHVYCTLFCAQAIEQLDGDWKLVYTSNSQLVAVLALSRLPLISVGDITQRIEASTMTVENKVGQGNMVGGFDLRWLACRQLQDTTSHHTTAKQSKAVAEQDD